MTTPLTRRKAQSQQQEAPEPGDGIEWVPLRDLVPAELNNLIYRPVDPDDPEIIELAEDIRANGLIHAIVVAEDNVVISGHRRRMACRLAGLRMVKVERRPVLSTDPGFPDLLVSANKQRTKTVAEIVREEVATMTVDADEAEREVAIHRQLQSQAAVERASPITLGDVRRRDGISKAKRPMLDKIIEIIEENREFWPLTNRYVHYQLLNHSILRHANKPQSA